MPQINSKLGRSEQFRKIYSSLEWFSLEESCIQGVRPFAKVPRAVVVLIHCDEWDGYEVFTSSMRFTG